MKSQVQIQRKQIKTNKNREYKKQIKHKKNTNSPNVMHHPPRPPPPCPLLDYVHYTQTNLSIGIKIHQSLEGCRHVVVSHTSSSFAHSSSLASTSTFLIHLGSLDQLWPKRMWWQLLSVDEHCNRHLIGL